MLTEKVVIAVIDVEFLIVEIQAGEQLVFFENVIGDYDSVRTGGGIERVELLESTHEECELCLESSPWFTLVKGFEKWIVLGLNDALRSPEVSSRFAQLNIESRPNTPEEFGAYVQDQMKLWSGIVKEAHITLG